MSTTDTNGRPWAKLSELKAGDYVELDAGFDCAKPGKVKVWEIGGSKCFCCYHGWHFIDGQADDGEHCIGIYGPVS